MRSNAAATAEIECVWDEHDETTVSVGPETHRRILAAAAELTADDEPTVRMRAPFPFPSLDVPSPLGNDAA